VSLFPDDPRHGKPSTYTNHKCRCSKCRAAWAAYVHRAQARRKQALIDDPTIAPHGRESTYGNYGCRCADCRAAWVKAAQHRKVRRLERKRREASA
jgi:hypothetical protein